MIVAMDPERHIGYQNTIPRHYPQDMKYFKQKTSWHVVVMWRKTFESIGKALPNRDNIVLSTNQDFAPSWVTVIDSVSSCLHYLKTTYTNSDKKIFIIWWSYIYTAFLPYTQKIYLTAIKKTYKWDVFFPVFEDEFTQTEAIQDENMDFITYTRHISSIED